MFRVTTALNRNLGRYAFQRVQIFRRNGLMKQLKPPGNSGSERMPKLIRCYAVGDDDSHPFLSARIPVITLHSVTQETLGLLHTPRDQIGAIHLDDLYEAYKLAASYLAALDSKLE